MAKRKHLLIISCSATKNKYDVPMPAHQVYAGPVFGAVRNRKTPDIDVVIISAKYGYLHWDTPIAWYNQKMTKSRAISLSRVVENGLKKDLIYNHYESVFVNLSSIYMITLGFALVGEKMPIILATGGIGEKMHQMNRWIENVQ